MDQYPTGTAKVATVAYRSLTTKMATPEDDWRGITDPEERRKRQNRLRQRVWRTEGIPPLICHSAVVNTILGDRQKTSGSNSLTVSTIEADSWKGYGVLIATSQPASATIEADSSSSSSSLNLCWTNYAGNRPSHTYQGHTRRSEKQIIVPALIPYATPEWFERGPPRIIFPLSADHQLITMIQYNVHRAALLNMAILNLLDCLPLECHGSRTFSPLCIDPPKTVPPDLQYTHLQQSTPHAYWIKLLPFPRMRDNLIRLAGKYDTQDLSYDMGKNLYEGFDSVEHRGCLVWGEPWTADGWEASEGFLKKWGFLLDGCSDLIESTNRWRATRGEDRLILEL